MYFLFLFDGEDFDLLVCKEGKDGFEKCICEVMLLLDYFFGEFLYDVNMSSFDGCVWLVECVCLLIVKLFDGVFCDLMV